MPQTHANAELALQSLQDVLSMVADRREIPTKLVRSDAEAWVHSWWTTVDVIAEPVFSLQAIAGLIGRNAGHYGVWHRVGPDETSGGGFLALHRVAIREARGNVERGTEAASETYLDVRGRLERTVDRAQRQRSLADFGKPGPIGEQNVHRYHSIQARLRLQGKWTKRRAQEAYEDGRRGREHDGFRQVEARTYTVPLHFAAWWTLLDTKRKQTRDGRVKDEAWWWQMLLHALDVVKLGELGSDRNDPTEALLRMRLRFAVTQGLAGWLRVWSKQHPYWRQVSFGLPDPDHTVARTSMKRALTILRPALERSLEHLDMDERERRALQGTLIRGENVRTSIRHMSGDDKDAKAKRLMALAEALGRRASDDLSGSGPRAPGGGGGGGHVHAHNLMAKMASGAPPSLDEITALRSAVAGCEHCRDHWGSTVDAEPYLRAASSPVTRSASRTWVGVSSVAMVLAAAALWVAIPSTEQVLLRGAASDSAVHLDLYVVAQGQSETQRFNASTAYATGDTVYFRVSADQASDVRVWVQTPSGIEPLARQSATATPQNLASPRGTVWYQFDAPGRYVFGASTEEGEQCEAPSCVLTEVEVR